jgi:hypothetical protein
MEAVGIARRLMSEARRAFPFDDEKRKAEYKLIYQKYEIDMFPFPESKEADKALFFRVPKKNGISVLTPSPIPQSTTPSLTATTASHTENSSHLNSSPPFRPFASVWELTKKAKRR